MKLSMKQFGVLVLIILGVILAFSPVPTSQHHQEKDVNLIAQIHNRSDMISADQLGEMIINKDPDYQLVDLRNPEEFNQFHIKTAINIPLDKLFDTEMQDLLDPEKLVILYTNSSVKASQAWVLMKENGYNNVVVLMGGLNYYVDVYSNPQPPSGVYADAEIARFEFRKSAGTYLLGNNAAVVHSEANGKPVAKLKPIRRKAKKKVADEGC